MSVTRWLVKSPLIYSTLAVLYTLLLANCVQRGMLQQVVDVVRASLPVPDVAALASFLKDTGVTALVWVHLLLLDLFVAREVYFDGLRMSVFTAHSLILCFMFGPTGILSHIVTKALKKRTTAHSATSR